MEKILNILIIAIICIFFGFFCFLSAWFKERKLRGGKIKQILSIFIIGLLSFVLMGEMPYEKWKKLTPEKQLEIKLKYSEKFFEKNEKCKEAKFFLRFDDAEKIKFYIVCLDKETFL